MKNKNNWLTNLAIILAVFAFVAKAGAQQSGTPAKPTKGTSSPRSTSVTEPTASAAESTDKVVIKVNSAQVTQSEIDFLISNLNAQAQETLAAQGRRPLGDEYVKVLLLSQQAISDHLESSPDVLRRIALQRTQMLAQAEYEKLGSEVKIGPDEVTQYFTAHQPEFESAQVREYVVRKRPEGAKDGALGLTEDEAKSKTDAIRKALASGTDAKKVAQDFVIANVVMADPEPRTVRRGQLLPALDKAAFDLKEGEVSDPVDTPQAMVFLQVVGHVHPEQKDVSADIENALRHQKLEAELADLRKKANIWLDEDYFKGQPATTSGSLPQQPNP